MLELEQISMYDLCSEDADVEYLRRLIERNTLICFFSNRFLSISLYLARFKFKKHSRVLHHMQRNLIFVLCVY